MAQLCLRTALSAFALIAAMLAAPVAACAQAATPIEELAGAVVHIKAFINPDGRSVQNLGGEREGSGIVIASDGLILTIGYLILEAHSAEVVTNSGHTFPANVVGYDHETGFGLLRAAGALGLRPIPFGKSADVKEQDRLLVASFGGTDMVLPVRVVSKREFAGSWEYLLEEAIFTAPPHPAWSGAALINREGKLVGVGSLIVGNASGSGSGTPGNMFVPIDRLGPILADLIAEGRVQGPAHPWLGMTMEDIGGRLQIIRVAPGGPAEKAGLQRGDVVIGVGGRNASGLADFYRKVWARGAAGASIPVDVLQRAEMRRIDIHSMDRIDHLRLKSTF